MTAAILAVLLAPGAVALALLDATVRERDGTRPPLVLRCALAAGIGIGIGSCAFFAGLELFAGSLAGTAAIDGALALAALVLWWSRRAAPARAAAAPAWSWLDRGLGTAVGLTALASTGVFVVNSLIAPHGEMDAWTTWNLKARFLFADPTRWRVPFADFFGHPDYPFFLPTAVAHGWRYLGTPAQGFSIAVAALYAVATLLLLIAVLAALRGRTVGLLAGLCLLGTPGFAYRAEWQYADVPLGYFLLASLALLVYWKPRVAPRMGALFWAGLALGLAAWTKNEGTLFLAVFAFTGVVLALRAGLDLYALAWFALGAAGPLALVVYYKSEIANRVFFLAGRPSGEIIAQIFSPGRYATIAAAIAGQILDSPSLWLALALPFFVFLMGPTPDPQARTLGRYVAAVAALIGVGFFFVYVLTPASLDWHLSTSLDRLMFDLWPSVILAVFLWTASPTERASTGFAE